MKNKVLISIRIALAVIMTIPLAANATMCSSTAQCKSPSVTFNNASGNTVQTVYTATSNGAKITGVYCYTSQTSPAVTLLVSFLHSGITTPLYISNVSLNDFNPNNAANTMLYKAGSSGAATMNGVPTDETGNQYLLLGSGDSLQINVTGSVISGVNTMSCMVQLIQY